MKNQIDIDFAVFVTFEVGGHRYFERRWVSCDMEMRLRASGRIQEVMGEVQLVARVRIIYHERAWMKLF